MKRNILLILILLHSLSTAGEKRLITFEDLYDYGKVDDIQVSPDGKYLAFTVTFDDLESNSSKANIWIMPTRGGEPRKMTNSSEDNNPRWSPDGKSLAFISGRENGDQVWLLPVDGGEAKRLTNLSTGASGLEWSPDGRRLIFTSRVYPECATDSCNQAKDDSTEGAPLKAKLYDHLLFRHYRSWDDGKRSHLFVRDLDSEKNHDLTPGKFNTPPIALAWGRQYDVSPDGLEVCFVMNTDSIITLSTNNDIFTVPLTGGEWKPITTNPANDVGPRYSPDGRYIAYRAMSRPGYESDRLRLMLYDRRTGEVRNLTPDFDRSVRAIVWEPASKKIFFTAVDRGRSVVYQITIKNGKISSLVNDVVCWDVAVSPKGKTILYLKSNSVQPYEIYAFDLKYKKEKRLTYLSKELFSHLELSPAEDFWFIGANGDSIHGFLTKPPNFSRREKYPLVLLIHGGPQWTWLGDFNYYGWNTQLVAAQGYIVAQIDPHGSAGYGQEFTDAVNLDWGGKDYQDLMLGIDCLIQKHHFIDAERLGALGRSYGGYMVNWIAGHTDRFKCLVSVDGVFELVSDYYSTDELWFPEWESGGPPWSNPEFYRQRSPSIYVENFKTPMLVIHGQNDYRVDVSQGLMLFTALQRLGVPSKLLYFPDEGHSVRKLKNLEYVYKVQFQWLAEYLK
ncbi:MAG: prolyl oligopeptidase family serine peptidase [Candidatus Zixiibacteriota bacterium]